MWRSRIGVKNHRLVRRSNTRPASGDSTGGGLATKPGSGWSNGGTNCVAVATRGIGYGLVGGDGVPDRERGMDATAGDHDPGRAVCPPGQSPRVPPAKHPGAQRSAPHDFFRTLSIGVPPKGVGTRHESVPSPCPDETGPSASGPGISLQPKVGDTGVRWRRSVPVLAP